MNLPLSIRRRIRSAQPAGDSVSPPKKAKVQRVAGQMNRTEKAYAAHLDVLKADGAVTWWAFEPMKLRLAANTYYSPDFLVLWDTGRFEFHEVKGFWRDDARVKIKCAAEKFPFQFVAVKKSKYGWNAECIASPFDFAAAAAVKEQP